DVNKYAHNKFTASCIALVPAISDTGSRRNRGRFGNSTIGTSPNGLGTGQTSSPSGWYGSHRVSRAFDQDSTYKPDSVRYPLEVVSPSLYTRRHFHNASGAYNVKYSNPSYTVDFTPAVARRVNGSRETMTSEGCSQVITGSSNLLPQTIAYEVVAIMDSRKP